MGVEEGSARATGRLQFSLATLLFAMIAAGAGVGLFFASRNAEARVKLAPKERELLQERADIAQQLYDIIVQQHKQGVTGTDNVIRAERKLCEAKLALRESREERIKVYEQMLAADVKLEEVVDARIKAGVAGRVDAMEARAARLEMEAKLEHEKAAK